MMERRIEDYALIGNLRTAALVHRTGSIEFLCFPHFDSPAVFAAMLGEPENGCWLIAPREQAYKISRRYIPGTLVLETEFETSSGAVRVTDFMPLPEGESSDLVRIVTGLRGEVTMHTDVRFRFDYGSVIPWVRRHDDGVSAIAGGHALRLRTPLPLEGQGWSTVSEFAVRAGESLPLVLTYHSSHESVPDPRDAAASLERTARWWRAWSDKVDAPPEWREAVVRSAITLKALCHAQTGGIVAAPTTSLPEAMGGPRNWDYRFCWLRDAAFTLDALMTTGCNQEAYAWRNWLVRAVAGEPSKAQIVYSLSGERRLYEIELPWLSGFGGSKPVRIGNHAYTQRQMDVYGEVMDALYCARENGLDAHDDAWRIQREFVYYLEDHWRDPGAGIWEQRSEDRIYVSSVVMTWVAVDRAIKSIERFGVEGPLERWKRLRQTIHDDVCRNGFSAERNAFVQYYGGTALDASVLLIALEGFLPVTDPRVVGTIEAIRRELTVDGFVLRYSTDESQDGLPGSEGAFLICSFWLADCLAMLGRRGEARALFERLLEIRNDLGLLAEEYDPRSKRQLGNFPQAFSHVGLIVTARNCAQHEAPAAHAA
jgi:GH15 family glucan-1,4-alpha-glucosidase